MFTLAGISSVLNTLDTSIQSSVVYQVVFCVHAKTPFDTKRRTSQFTTEEISKRETTTLRTLDECLSSAAKMPRPPPRAPNYCC